MNEIAIAVKIKYLEFIAVHLFFYVNSMMCIILTVNIFNLIIFMVVYYLTFLIFFYIRT